MFLEDCCLPFARRKTIGSSVLVTCTSIGATVWRDILLIYSALDPEDTWLEAAHAWVFCTKSIGLRGCRIVFAKLSLMMFPSETLKVYYASIKMEFMW